MKVKRFITNGANFVAERPPHGLARANGWYPSRSRRVRTARAKQILGAGGVSRESQRSKREHPLVAINHRRVNKEQLRALTAHDWAHLPR